MAVVETERHGQVLVVRMNRPERLNALNHEMRTELAETWTEFRHDDELEVAIFTGTGRGFCAGEDMKESLQRGTPGGRRPGDRGPVHDRARWRSRSSPRSTASPWAAASCWSSAPTCASPCAGRCSRSPRPSAGCSAATITATSPTCPTRSPWRWRWASASPPSASTRSASSTAWSMPTELMPTALAMAEHLLTLPPASRVNTVHMMRQMRPAPSPEQQRLAAALHEHGAKSDLMEFARRLRREAHARTSRAGTIPQDRYRLPTLDSVKG